MKKGILIILLISTWAPVLAKTVDTGSLDLILADIETLEGVRDPKCYAAAARLEDFMYGTPLSDAARFQKNKLQKRLADVVWRKGRSECR